MNYLDVWQIQPVTLFEPKTYRDWKRWVTFFIWCSPSGVWQDIADFDLQPVMTFNSGY